MQSTYGRDSAGGTGPGTGSKASEAAHQTKDAAKEVAGTAKEEARHLGDQVKAEVRGLTEDTRDQLRQQASAQTDKVTGSLRRLGDQAGALADGRPEESGPLAGYVNSAAERLRHAAERTEERGFEGIIEDTKRFARERPALFLGIAAVAGFSIGRLMRGGAASHKQREERARTPESTAPRPYRREAGPYPVEHDIQEPYAGSHPVEETAGPAPFRRSDPNPMG